MTASNATIRRVLFDALDLPGVNRYKYPPDSIVTPAAVVAGIDMKRATYEGGRQSTATVMVVVSHSDVDQLATLDELLDPTGAGSVMAALDATDESDGVSLAWDDAGSYGEVQWNGIAYYGAVITVKVWT